MPIVRLQASENTVPHETNALKGPNERVVYDVDWFVSPELERN